MTKSKRLRTALVLFAFGTAFGLLLNLWPQGPAHRLGPEGYGRIRDGMTEAEVRAVLRVAEGN